ncbi:MAG: transketolase [Spirochaetia bacterium]
MDTKSLEHIALSIRTLSADGVEQANSGHPGLPLGCAELGALLYGELMNYFPGAPDWINRDRFVLSAGHGSMFLYSLLYLSGYDLTIEDLRNFRQLGYKTPGHPEYGHTQGVETTTGPLGQGFSNAVGMALAESHLSAVFNTDKHRVIDHYVYALASDGCIMEGISGEAASLAGHLGLGKLIVFYDSNQITIEGSTDLAFSEDVMKRFDAYGWHTQKGSGYDFEGISKMVQEAKDVPDKPSLILLETVIGKGAPSMEGSAKVHGAALGADEIKALRRNLGIDEAEEFYVHPGAVDFFMKKRDELKNIYTRWTNQFSQWSSENPELKKKWDYYFSENPDYHTIKLPEFNVGDSMATRKASGAVLNAIAGSIPNLIGGSADLAPSNNTNMKGMGDFSKDERTGRNLHFGVREHAMGAVINGMCLYGGLRPFCATFLVFSDYMRTPIRLAALMNLPVVYVFTHDSIFVGEDGPTHQPIEHVASLRAIPNLRVLRPGDAQETALAWQMALEREDGPTVLALTRQNLPVYEKQDADWEKNARKGAYIVSEAGEPDRTIIATGSEVSLAVKTAQRMKDEKGMKIRVVSMVSKELFQAQDKAFRDRIVPPGVKTVVAEAGVSLGWEGFAGVPERLFTLDRFGASGPGKEVAEYLGLTEDILIKKLAE